MKTHRSTQLFIYYSEGERSVKCVPPALEMEADKEKQRLVVRFLEAEVVATRQKPKQPGPLSDGISVFHDNARPHTANLVRDKLQRFGWKILPNPPYSLHLSSCVQSL